MHIKLRNVAWICEGCTIDGLHVQLDTDEVLWLLQMNDQQIEELRRMYMPLAIKQVLSAHQGQHVIYFRPCSSVTMSNSKSHDAPN